MNNQIKTLVAAVLVLGAGVFAYTYFGNSNSADGSNPPGITIDYPKFKGELNPNVICSIPKAYKFTSDADSKYKTGDAEAKDLQSGIHMYHSDTDIFVQDIVDRIDSVKGNMILIAYYPSSENPSNLFSVFPELNGQNAISASDAKAFKIPANEGFTIFSCKASKIYGIKTETEFGSDLPAILKSKADSGWVLMAAKKPASGKDVKKEMKEVNDDNKSKNKPKIKSAWPQKGKGFSFSGSQQPDALAVDSTYKMVWVEMSTEDIKKDPTPELTLYATNGSEVSVKKGDTVVLDFIELMSSNKVANVKSIDFSNAGTDVLANLSGYKLFFSSKSDDGKTLKDAKEVTGCTIKPVSLKINVACTTGSLSINPASPLYLELRATIAQTAVLTKTFKVSIASLDDIKLYESGFKKTNYYASPAYTAGGKAAIDLPIYWNTYTLSEAAAPAAISVPTGLSFDKASKILTWDQSTGPVDSYSVEVYSKGIPTILPKVKDNNTKQSLSISGYDSTFAYSFRVKACNGATCSAYSETYVVEAPAPASLSAPTGLEVDNPPADTALHLYWDEPSKAPKSYHFWITKKDNNTKIVDDNKVDGSSGHYFYFQLTPGTEYTIYLAAIGADDKDGQVATISYKTANSKSTQVQPPKNLTVKNSYTDSFELTWDPPSDMTASSIKEYKLTYGTGTEVGKNVAQSPFTSPVAANSDASGDFTTPKTLTPNTNYWFSVTTIDKTGKESAAITLNTAKTKAAEAIAALTEIKPTIIEPGTLLDGSPNTGFVKMTANKPKFWLCVTNLTDKTTPFTVESSDPTNIKLTDAKIDTYTPPPLSTISFCGAGFKVPDFSFGGGSTPASQTAISVAMTVGDNTPEKDYTITLKQGTTIIGTQKLIVKKVAQKPVLPTGLKVVTDSNSNTDTSSEVDTTKNIVLKWEPQPGTNYIWRIMNNDYSDSIFKSDNNGMGILWELKKDYNGGVSSDDSICFANKKWSCNYVNIQGKVKDQITTGKYKWGVKAYNDAGESDWATLTFTIKPAISLSVTPKLTPKGVGTYYIDFDYKVVNLPSTLPESYLISFDYGDGTQVSIATQFSFNPSTAPSGTTNLKHVLYSQLKKNYDYTATLYAGSTKSVDTGVVTTHTYQCNETYTCNGEYVCGGTFSCTTYTCGGKAGGGSGGTNGPYKCADNFICTSKDLYCDDDLATGCSTDNGQGKQVEVKNTCGQ